MYDKLNPYPGNLKHHKVEKNIRSNKELTWKLSKKIEEESQSKEFNVQESKRKTTNQRGMVNFPTHLKNTNEGGTYIRLGVREKKETDYNDLWLVCCGGYNNFYMDGSYQGNNIRGSFEADYNINWDSLQTIFEQEIFPFYGGSKEERSFEEEYVSPNWLSITTIGSTGWTGTREDGSDWICGYNDLTEEGKQFYDILKRTYPDSEILLMTFIDT
jgi:hypothetical protein